MKKGIFTLLLSVCCLVSCDYEGNMVTHSMNFTEAEFVINATDTVSLTLVDAADKAITPKCAWVSIAPGKVKVLQDGKAIGVYVGKSMVTATTEDADCASCYVSVIPVMKIEKETLTLKVGDTDSLWCDILPREYETLEDANGDSYQSVIVDKYTNDPISNLPLTWKSSDEKVVTVEDGKIKAVKAGTAELVVVEGSTETESTVCVVTVEA